MASIAFIVIAYLIGSLSFAVIVSRALGLPDPHTYGSGNPGATNVLRTGNKLAAALTLAGDGAKGWLAVFLAQAFAWRFGLGGAATAAVALAVFAGHLWPLFFRFRGGKGVATAAGILFALDWRIGLGTLATWLVVAVVFRYSSLAGLVAAVFAPLFTALALGFGVHAAAVLAIAALLVWRHAENIRKLLAGQERRIGEKRSPEISPPPAARRGPSAGAP
ncbi:MAG: glycerol-3-phosphate 1-O-acyltransferase PlsY [Burkholderiales bacterium]